MALYKGKKALYEAIAAKKSQSQSPQPAVAPLRPAAKQSKNGPAASSLFKWPTKPKAFQHSGDRIDLSLTVPVAVTVGLGILAVLLVAFQIGKFAADKEQPIAASAVASVEATRLVDAPKPAKEVKGAATPAVARPETVKPAAAASNKTNWIVIQQYQVGRDLEPVKEYFAKNGIETKIVSRMSRGRQMFFLVTAEMFESTVRPGSEGYQAVQQIRKLGAGYKAPAQYESFAPHLFSDAYGEKVSQ